MQETAPRRRLLDAETARALAGRLSNPSGLDIRGVALHAVHRPAPDVALSAWRVSFVDGVEGPVPDAMITIHQGPPSRIQRDQRHFEGRAERAVAGELAGCVLEGDETMVVAFPSDHRLRDLRWLHRPSNLIRLVVTSGVDAPGPGERFSKRRSACAVLRYVPEQRAVLQWDLPIIDDATGEVRRSVSVHALVDGRAPALDPQVVARSLASIGVLVPTVLARPHAGVVLETTVPGRSWHGEPEDAEVLGAAIARLHGAETSDDAPRTGVVDELDRVLTAARLLKASDAGLGKCAFAVADALAMCPPPPCPPAMLHGSLRPSRFRVRDGQPGLVGLGQAIVGSAAMDLASLWSEANWDSFDAAWMPRFEQGYASVRPLPGASTRRWFLAAAMVRTACRRGIETSERRSPEVGRWLEEARALAESTSR
ncbi:MAG: phosphotransferase [Planctomycetota bacterium]|nr:phosphotransferase [Planctomycetota bacterium]MDA0933380.1 phosphotransferase [Planctomycetota bacterium]